MAGKLTQDEIKWILSIDAKGANKEIAVVSSEINKLANANKVMVQDMKAAERQIKDTEREMAKLAKAGKEDSDAYKQLQATRDSARRDMDDYTRKIGENNRAIETNKNKIGSLEKTMSLSEMTMKQLRNRAKELQMQLNVTSRATNPAAYDRLQKELAQTNSRMIDLKNNAHQLSRNMGRSMFSKGAFASFFGNVYAQVFMKLTAMVSKAKEFVRESVEMASKAQGIDHAFSRIANKDYLKSLREQTKGLISDFTLMKSAVRAENFDIPLSQLGKLLEFAQNRARDTGESVDYLVESIVNGIGRKSPLILDNLGISAVRLREEVKKTGDFASTVGKIVEEEMTKAGPAIDTAADAATRKKVAWENLQLATGKFFLGFKTGWDNFSTRFAEGVAKIISGQEKMSKQYEDQINKVASLNTTLHPLLSRYEELKTKTSLTAAEQEELNKIMRQVSDIVPGAAVEFDKYGNVLSINTQKVWDFIDAETAKLEIMNAGAIKEETKNLEKYRRELNNINAARQAGTKSIYISKGLKNNTIKPYFNYI